MEKAKSGYVEGAVSVIVNSALFALKMWASVVTGSLALMADAWHTLSDSLTSIVVVIAAKLSSRKADKEHPFGHGRWDQIAAIFMAIALGIVGYEFMKDAISQFGRKETVHYGIIAIVVTAISIVAKEAMAQYAFYIAKKSGNVSVKADGWHHRTDALSSVVVLVGILLAKYFWWIDSALTAVISLFLFFAAFKIINEAVTKLLGEEPSQELITEITAIARNSYPDNLQIHHFHIHDYISQKELTVHIRLDGNMTIEKGHQIATDIENKIKERLNIITTIHIDPLISN